MTALPAFNKNNTLTLGVELELQLTNLQNFDLTMEAEDFLRRLSTCKHAEHIKPEITQAMIEINSQIHDNYTSLLSELRLIRDVIANEAKKTHIGVCGGGTHPFQKWKEQRIFQNERFATVSETYGYLAKQFTVFGQHIHIAVPNGDDALYLCHALAAYLPHFIAITAASPFNQGVDTSFDCSRLGVISAFPLSGTPPWILEWNEFEDYFNKMATLGIIKSMKDFYWDIRPKPEFGTVEIRICDTPLTVDKAADIAAYAQMLVHWLLEKRPVISREIYLTYLFNRFRASRYGIEAVIVDPVRQTQEKVSDAILATCVELEVYANKLGADAALNNIRTMIRSTGNDASWLRREHARLCSLPDVVRAQIDRWAK